MKFKVEEFDVAKVPTNVIDSIKAWMTENNETYTDYDFVQWLSVDGIHHNVWFNDPKLRTNVECENIMEDIPGIFTDECTTCIGLHFSYTLKGGKITQPEIRVNLH